MIILVAGGVILWVRTRTTWSFQERNIQTLSVLVGGLMLFLVWWLSASRAPWRMRLLVTGAFVCLIGIALALFRIHGVSGDLRPVFQFRWAKAAGLGHPDESGTPIQIAGSGAFDFPQFLGPNRTAILEGPGLNRDWQANRPQVLWRKPIGAAWSGWAVVGRRAFTQEQRLEGECVTCYDALTGRLLWSHADPAHYQSVLAGEGPRCTPTVLGNSVFALGATGILNCLDATSGKRLWFRNIVGDAQSRLPEWGFSGSPLVVDGKVIVSSGGSPSRSLLAYDSASGQLVWSAGDRWISYGSPFLATLSGVRQILAFNSRKITAHDATSGQVLWEYPWGIGEPQVAAPVVVGTNRVLFSSGYGVGSELLEVSRIADGHWGARRLWKSTRMKAKFANLVQRQGFLFGLDDGVLCCLDLKDGSQCWKAGRYGHGQGLLVKDLYVLMAENGELILLQPTPRAPNELHRLRVFPGKTWNPIALAGNLLLARTDRQAACLRLALDASTAAPEARQ